MAPVLSASWGPGVAVSLPLVAVVTASLLLLLLLLLLLCASCQGQTKGSLPIGDHENLINGVSEREGITHSVDSAGTELAASSSQNGPLTSGTVLTDNTLDSSPQLSENILSSQSELRSSKCPQDRELPSIPPSGGLEGATTDPQPSSGDGTYEVVKESASRDVSVEDSLYETVKELKEPGMMVNGNIPPLLNGNVGPRGPLSLGAEYASVDLNKKSRYSADLEARRSAEAVPKEPEEEEEEEEKPPPIPDKVLDENENQPGVGLENSELSAVYSKVLKSPSDLKENDYSSIGEIKGLLPESSSSDLYATVKDICPPTATDGVSQSLQEGREQADPDYETIRILTVGGSDQQEEARKENDYESVSDLELNREISRL